jgi:hypothetical protein
MPREIPYPHPGEILSQAFLIRMKITVYRTATHKIEIEKQLAATSRFEPVAA